MNMRRPVAGDRVSASRPRQKAIAWQSDLTLGRRGEADQIQVMHRAQMAMGVLPII